MFYAARGVPDLGLVVATVVGGTFSAGRRRLNCVYDRDIHEQMRRTRRRAAAAHRVAPLRPGLRFVVLGILSTVILYVG